MKKIYIILIVILTVAFTNKSYSQISADLLGTPTNLTVGQSVIFTDLSSGAPTSWVWTFTGGTPATYNLNSTPPPIDYNTAGTYDVKLVISNGTISDSITKTGYITVSAANLQARFSATPLTLTAGQTVTFTDLSTGGPTTWDWSFTGGTPAFSSSQNPVIQYNTSGVYPVQLIVTNAFDADTLIQTAYITVRDSLIANFTGTPTTVNVGGSVTFTDQTSGAPVSWIWSFPGGDQTSWAGQVPPVIVYNTLGTYTVELVVSDGTNTDTKTRIAYIRVIDPASVYADFVGTPTSLLVGNTVQFTDLSVGTPIVWNWTFSSGIPPAYNGQIPPAVKYTHSGVFDVKLKVSKPSHSDTQTKIGYIHVYDSTSLPVAKFNSDFTTVPVGSTVNFFDLSLNMGNNATPVFWDWTFTGATPQTATSTLKNPTNILYNTVGVYPVSLKVQNFLGRDSITKIAYINVFDPSLTYDTIKIDFTANKRLISVGDSINFTDLTTGYPSIWNWEFEGVGGVAHLSSVQNPQSVKYNSPGVFRVCLDVANAISFDSLCKTKYIVVTSFPWPDSDGYCDTVGNVDANDVPMTYRHLIPNAPVTWGGYFPGHNGYKVKRYAERMTNYTISNIHSIIIKPSRAFASATTPDINRQRVKWYVWDVAENGNPGKELGSVYRNINSFTPNIASVINFNNPIPVDGNFYVGFEIFYYSPIAPNPVAIQLDTFALFMSPNRGANGKNTLLVSTYGGIDSTHWTTPSAILNDTLNVSLDLQIVGCLLGVKEVDYNEKIQVYPNPTNKYVNIDIEDINVKNIDVEIYDMLGKLIKVETNKQDSNHLTLDLSTRPPGLYFVNIRINNKIIIRKISLIK